jgi:hypothetical protein
MLRPFISRNYFTTYTEKRYPAPRLFIDHPYCPEGSGSLHTKSHIGPLSGMSLCLEMAEKP